MNTPLQNTMIAIKHAPLCPTCGGTGLTEDELAECDACSGFGRGAGLFKAMIEKVTADVKAKREQRDAQSPASFKIGDYRDKGAR